MRTIDSPPFLDVLPAHQMGGRKARSCTCRGTEEPWCSGGRHVFLSPSGAHFRRSDYSERVFRPAGGWYPKRSGKHGKPAMPVLVDMGALAGHARPALAARAGLAPRSGVAILDELLAPHRGL
ncbi:hypothetical protein [Actinomadura sp. 21ATH]|uniref:hypothetical protein n=1 Tax=Actinomadura sp. 21ATH TaxID=1735444 RepID=UPI0035C0A98F